MWDHMQGWGWGGLGMGLGMLVFWVLVIAAIVAMAKAFSGPRDPERRRKEKSALDILNERYARGEIGREEYEQKKRDLEG